MAFDPKPFIRTFEAAVDKLIAVRKDVQTKTEQQLESVNASGDATGHGMETLDRDGHTSCVTYIVGIRQPR